MKIKARGIYLTLKYVTLQRLGTTALSLDATSLWLSYITQRSLILYADDLYSLFPSIQFKITEG